jgi:hypothetical protein
MAGLEPNRTGLDQLALVLAVRRGGAGKTERSYLDFVVNRRRLSGLIHVGDHIGVLGWQPRRDERRCARQLLLRETSPFPEGLVPLYICPECADLGCGAVTVRITVRDGCVVWSDLRWNDPLARLDEPRTVRELWFDRQEYQTVLGGHAR